jgi:AraC-like DNA-binding protein
MSGPVKMRTLYIGSPAAAGLPQGCRVVGVSALLRELILRAVELPVLYDEGGAAGRVAALIFDELRLLPTLPLHLPKPRDARLERLCQALRANPADQRTLEEWGAVVGASARTLARGFVKETGMSFAAWRAQVRLLAALARLAAGEKVTAVALDLGYDNVSAFIAAFRRVHGTTPGRWAHDAPA